MKKSLLLVFILIPGISAAQTAGILPDSAVTYRFNGPADSVFSTRYAYEYDATGNMTLQTYARWDSANGVWFENMKKEYTCNSSGKLTESIGYYRDSEASDWEILGKEERTYDPVGNRTATVHYFWDVTSQGWFENSREEYAYDSAGNRILRERYNWDPDVGDWLENSRTQYAYDPEGRRTLRAGYSRDPDSDEWIENSRTRYTYDSGEDWTEVMIYTWETGSNEWIENFKKQYAYDTDGNLTLHTSYLYDPNRNEYVEQNKIEYTPDSAGNPAFIVAYDRDTDIGDWIGFGQYIRSYLPGGELIVDTQYDRDANGNGWVPDIKEYYYYPEILYTQEAVICRGDSLLWKGQYLRSDSTYRAVYPAASGQDIVYEVNLHVDPGPSSFVITGQTMVDASSTHMYTAPPQQNVTYSWSVENGSIRSDPDDHFVEILWETAGTGRIRAVAETQYGCVSDTSTLEVTIGSTGTDPSGHREISVYPSPVSNFLYISTGGYAENYGYQLKLINQLGITIFETRVEESLYRVDLASRTVAGMYYLLLIEQGGTVIDTRKIMVR